jgi:hypothetical protein
VGHNSIGIDTALAEEAGVCAVRRGTAITANAHEAGAAGEHALDGMFGPVAEGIAVLFQVQALVVIMLEQQLCGSRNIHGAERVAWHWKRASVSACSRCKRAHFMRL